MASVIDSLIVKLGMDSSGFKRGAQEAAEITKKTKKQVAEEAKAEAERKKKAEEGFRKLRASAMLFFAALTGARGLADFVKNTVAMGAGLDRSSKVLGVSANNLSKWGGAAKVAGGSMDAFMGTMQGLNQQLTQLKETGDAPMRMLLSRLGVAAADGQGRAKDVLTLTGDIADAMGKLTNVSESDKFNWLLGAGFDEGTARLMLMAEKERKDLIASMKGMTDEQAKKMREIDERWTSIKEKYSAMSRDVLIKLMPSIEKLSNTLMKGFDHVVPIITVMVDKFVELNDASDGWLVAVLAAVAAIKVASVLLPGMATAATTMATALKAIPVAAAGGGGYALGTWLYDNHIAGTSAGDWIGEKVAQGLALLGNEEAQRALDINKDGKIPQASKSSGGSKSQFDASGSKGGSKSQFDAMFVEAGKKYGIDPLVLKATVLKENAQLNPNATNVNKNGTIDEGLMQLNNKYHASRGVTNAFDVQQNIDAAAKLWSENLKRSGGDIRTAARMYNGSGAMAERYADDWMRIYSQASLNGYTPSNPYASGATSGVIASGGSGGGNSSVTIGKVEIVTQATDASGMARDAHAALVRQFDYALR